MGSSLVSVKDLAKTELFTARPPFNVLGILRYRPSYEPRQYRAKLERPSSAYVTGGRETVVKVIAPQPIHRNLVRDPYPVGERRNVFNGLSAD